MNGKSCAWGLIIARFYSPFVAVPPLCKPRQHTRRSFFGNISHLPLHNRLTIKICFLLAVDFSQSINFRFSIYRSRWEEEKKLSILFTQLNKRIRQKHFLQRVFTTTRSIERKFIINRFAIALLWATGKRNICVIIFESFLSQSGCVTATAG